MTRLVEVAAELQSCLDAQGWKNCLIGGIVLQRWGEPRLTKDVDMTVMTGFGGEEPLLDLLLARYPARLSDARDFALKARVLLLRTQDGIGLDIALGALPFEERVIARATEFEFIPCCPLRTCSAEDLVVMKCFADRERDWLDVESILIRQGATLNWATILDELRPLCELKESPQIVDRLQKAREQFQPT